MRVRHRTVFEEICEVFADSDSDVTHFWLGHIFQFAFICKFLEWPTCFNQMKVSSHEVLHEAEKLLQVVCR